MSRIGLTIKSTELRPGEVMRATHIAGAYLWSPEDGLGWWFVDDCRDMPGADGIPAWPLCERPDFKGTIIAVDVPADAETLARVCRGEAALSIDTSGPTTMTAPAEGLPLVVTISGRVVLAPGQSLTYESGAAVAVEHPDATLIDALRAHPDPLGLLARAKIATRWGEAGAMLCRYDVGSGDPIAYSPHDAAVCRSEDARLLADGWRLL